MKTQNQFLDLPADPDESNYPRQVFNSCYSFVEPVKPPKPYLIAHSSEMAQKLGMSEEFALSPEFLKIMSGQAPLDDCKSYAMCYGGHQFGNWAGQLGDGRAINIGEVLDTDSNSQVLQLKGAGPTPYSRSGDGYAVLRSSVREFLCSEAMHHLGIPTTRALSLLGTGEDVMRDMFYNGNIQMEPGAIVCRVAPSFLRFGNYQLPASRNDKETLQKLVDFTMKNHFSHITKEGVDGILEMFAQVCETTGKMVVDWMRVGFVHGVMNTDNMSILGLTIDYGPYGWLEDYDPAWTPNTTDSGMRRYCYGAQPQIAQWNLCRFGDALLPLIGDVEPLQEILEQSSIDLGNRFSEMMCSKLALPASQSGEEELFSSLNELLQSEEIDQTLFYRSLANCPLDEKPEVNFDHMKLAYYSPDKCSQESKTQLNDFVGQYRKRLDEYKVTPKEREESMNRVNPLYVLRNYLAQLAIDEATEGKYERILETLEVLRNPYTVQEGKEEFCAKRPEWARSRPGCSMLSCSS